MKNILITGGAGFIGSNLALELLKIGFKVRVYDNLLPKIHGENSENSYLYKSIKNKVEFINGDIKDKSSLKKALIDQNIVVHLAAETGTGESMYKIGNYCETNIIGTSNLLDLLAENNNYSIKKLVIASSRSIYGEGKYNCIVHGEVYPKARKNINMAKGDFNVKCPECGMNVKSLSTDENSKIQPESIYSLTKYNQEKMCLLFGKSFNIPVVAFRYQNVYGPGQSLSNPYTGILSIFSTIINNNNKINIFEDGNESRDFVFIKDVVDATILGIIKDEANYNIYNVGSGEATSVLNVVQKLSKYFKQKVKYRISGDYRLGDIRDNYADLTKIKNDLNFEPKFTLDEGIKLFINWVSTQETKQDNFLKSYNEMKNKGFLK